MNFEEPHRVAQHLTDLTIPWWICGGWAIDVFLGRMNRAHKDVDIAILRKDQLAAQAYLSARGWTLEKAQSGRLIPWAVGEILSVSVHVVWCRNPQFEPDFLEILLNEADETHFRFRRDPSITRRLDRAFLQAGFGLPILAPEIVLLYKAKGDSEENRTDFQSVLPHLDAEQRTWLGNALKKLHPGHEWLNALKQ